MVENDLDSVIANAADVDPNDKSEPSEPPTGSLQSELPKSDSMDARISNAEDAKP